MTADYLRYFVFGLSVALTCYIFAMGDHLWKKSFFRTCLVIAGMQLLAGIAIETLRLIDATPGIVIVTMSAPMIFLAYFSLLRYVYKRIYRTEPVITSASSTIGSPPLDMFSSAYRDGNKIKYAKDRRVTMADFVFSFLHALAPAFTILAMIALVKKDR